MNHLLVFEMNCKLLMEKLVSWYRKLFDTEKAVPLKNQFLYGKGGTNNNSILLQYRSYRD